MQENQQGYDLPYSADPSVQIAWICIGLLALAGSFWLYREEAPMVLVIIAVIFLAIILCYTGQLLARLHIAPEGISITLFGRSLRRWPAETIQTIVALRKYEGKANPHDVMAVCNNTVEELTELGNRRMPKLLKQEADRWCGEAAAKYLYRRAMSFQGELNLHKHILWMDWSPERLAMLREMYPRARWLDCTQKKLFEAQLKSK